MKTNNYIPLPPKRLAKLSKKQIEKLEYAVKDISPKLKTYKPQNVNNYEDENAFVSLILWEFYDILTLFDVEFPFVEVFDIARILVNNYLKANK